MNLFHAEEMAEDVLADLVVDEISNLENEHLTFRLVYICSSVMLKSEPKKIRHSQKMKIVLYPQF